MMQSISAHGNENHNEKIKYIRIHWLTNYIATSRSGGHHANAQQPIAESKLVETVIHGDSRLFFLLHHHLFLLLPVLPPSTTYYKSTIHIS